MTLKIKLIIFTLIAIILTLGIVIASLAGRVAGLEDAQRIYLKAACHDKDTFLRVLTETDLSQYSERLKIFSVDFEQAKPGWILEHMQRCDQVDPGEQQ